ncbi:hypothetical protein DAPPUDRAFT_246729 [Daphnia pulex]|uniref:Uncharacterized protein n=1 Tax=Daphnia pulex TaxID=6669 RepID=E9GR45_DAPPU|nr:hypothetical protein DAPPUDRAFT_246729 [Daphnia pulex]|eukprot:EFX78057.1 hypothetical protein DAPPUDRAFT_246729 [Daphnia pulex]
MTNRTTCRHLLPSRSYGLLAPLLTESQITNAEEKCWKPDFETTTATEASTTTTTTTTTPMPTMTFFASKLRRPTAQSTETPLICPLLSRLTLLRRGITPADTEESLVTPSEPKRMRGKNPFSPESVPSCNAVPTEGPKYSNPSQKQDDKSFLTVEEMLIEEGVVATTSVATSSPVPSTFTVGRSQVQSLDDEFMTQLAEEAKFPVIQKVNEEVADFMNEIVTTPEPAVLPV